MPSPRIVSALTSVTPAPILRNGDLQRASLIHQYPGVDFRGTIAHFTRIGPHVRIAPGAQLHLCHGLVIRGRTQIGPSAIISGNVEIWNSSVEGVVYNSTVEESHIAHDAKVLEAKISKTTIHTGGRAINTTLRKCAIFEGGVIERGEHEYVFVDNYRVMNRVAKYICYKPSSQQQHTPDQSPQVTTYHGYTARGGTVNGQAATFWDPHGIGYPTTDAPFEGAGPSTFVPRAMTAGVPQASLSNSAHGHAVDHSGQSAEIIVQEHESRLDLPQRSLHADDVQMSGLRASSDSSSGEGRSDRSDRSWQSSRESSPNPARSEYSFSMSERNTTDKDQEIYNTWSQMNRNRIEKYDCADIPTIFLDRNISYDMIHDAVITPNGDIYDRAVIEHWIARRGTDPKTRSRLRKGDLFAFRGLTDMIDEWKSQHLINPPRCVQRGEQKTSKSKP